MICPLTQKLQNVLDACKVIELLSENYLIYFEKILEYCCTNVVRIRYFDSWKLSRVALWEKFSGTIMLLF